jgi:hypothetical protein
LAKFLYDGLAKQGQLVIPLLDQRRWRPSRTRRFPSGASPRPRDGARLSRRDMGPIWIVYPRDEFPELQLETVNARWIWQLTELEVR